MGFRKLWKPNSKQDSLVLTIPKDIREMIDSDVLYVDWYDLVRKHKDAITAQELPVVNNGRDDELSPEEEFDFRGI